MTSSVPRIAGRIFITYRREESAWQADRLFGLLEGRFGEGMVFRDVASIQPGAAADHAVLSYEARLHNSGVTRPLEWGDPRQRVVHGDSRRAWKRAVGTEADM
jgi:hypothetical protein